MQSGKSMKRRNKRRPVDAGTGRPIKDGSRLSNCLSEGVQSVFVSSKLRKCITVTDTSDHHSSALKHVIRSQANEILEKGPGPAISEQ